LAGDVHLIRLENVSKTFVYDTICVNLLCYLFGPEVFTPVILSLHFGKVGYR
jgi:hypothetical protein